MKKFGIAITTRNRSEWLKRLFDSIKDTPNCEKIVIVNDGPSYDWIPDGKNVTYIVNLENLGISKSKNIGIRHLLDIKGIDYIFTIEDDVLVKDQDVFKKTIQASEHTGLSYFNFPAYSYGAGEPHKRTPVVTIDYDNLKVDFFPNLSAVFSFFTKDIILKGGLYDEDFWNCFVDGEHIYRYSRLSEFTPFWYFPCISDIDNYVEIIDGCVNDRQAAKNDVEWNSLVNKHFKLFQEKHNIAVQNIPRVSIDELKNRLSKIYRRKVA